MQFIDLKRQYQQISEQVEAGIQQVLQHGQYIRGPEVGLLEQQLADFVGVKHAVALSSGTTALQVALMAAGVGAGDEVIVPSFSFFATAEVVMLLGAVPVMVDIDPKTYNIDVNQLAQTITHKTKALMPVSLYGFPANMNQINKLAKDNNVIVIEDAAQSFGAIYHGKRSCGLTDMGATSFFPSKPLGGYGDGGALFTNDDTLAELSRSIIDHGQTKRYCHGRLGINGRMSSIQAAILIEKLKIFPQEIELRKKVASWYQKNLAGFTMQDSCDGVSSVFAQFTIEVDQRDDVIAALKAESIPTAVHYPLGMHEQMAYINYMTANGWAIKTSSDLPHTARAARRVLSLPFHPYLTQVEVEQVTAALQAIHCGVGS